MQTTFPAEFADMMTDRITLRPYVGQDEYTEARFGDPVSLPARVVYRTRHVEFAAAQEIISTTTVYVGADVAVDTRDEITLPNGSQPTILHVNRFPDMLGGVVEILT